MLITHERDKLINAIIFFAQNTRQCGKVKLFKLLYFLDFEHFKLTGRNVTGLDYYAWQMGPVPRDLYEELKQPDQDLSDAVDISEITVRQRYRMLTFKPRAEFSGKNFSKRERRLMIRLAEQFHDSRADDMVEATHLENQPWHHIYEIEGRNGGQIPYELATRKQERDEVMAVARAHQEVMESLR